MSESFADLFEESISQTQMKPGSILTGTVIDIRGDFVMVHAGLKSEGVIPVEQFMDETGNIAVSIGEEVEVALDSVEDGSDPRSLANLHNNEAGRVVSAEVKALSSFTFHCSNLFMRFCSFFKEKVAFVSF